MKTNKLSSLVLKYMVKSFYENQNNCFQFNSLLNEFPNQNKELLKTAVYALKCDGFVNVSHYDNLPNIIYLNVTGILNIDEDTLLRKGYTFISEIKSYVDLLLSIHH